MKLQDRERAQRLEEGLLYFHREKQPLPGIQDTATRLTLIRQLIDSIHRVTYPSVIRTLELSDRRADPNDELFDPLKAAILHQRQGHTDEAFWLVFLFVHFGKHSRTGWRYAGQVYGRLGSGGRWDWASTSADPSSFREWLGAHQNELRRDRVRGGFGSHRKYESLDAYSPRGTGEVVESYVNWVKPPRNHQQLIAEALERTNGNPRAAFDSLYKSMNSVARFGRLARFDYLTMVGKLDLAPIEPGSTYMQQSTGPAQGARLLFDGHKNGPSREARLDQLLVELDAELRVGMQVLEDALCNWQKNPAEYQRFRG